MNMKLLESAWCPKSQTRNKREQTQKGRPHFWVLPNASVIHIKNDKRLCYRKSPAYNLGFALPRVWMAKIRRRGLWGPVREVLSALNKTPQLLISKYSLYVTSVLDGIC